MSPTVHPGVAPRPWQLGLGYATIYLVWGSTFLAIQEAVHVLPPFLMAGSRFLLAGALLFVGSGAWRARAGWAEWRAALVTGGLLFLGGNGLLAWSETRIASGLAAVLLATIPLCFVALESAVARRLPSLRQAAALAFGVAGVVALVGPSVDGAAVDGVGTAVLMVGALSWAAGTLLSRRLPRPRSLFHAAALQMLGGGALLWLAGLASGEAVPRALPPVGPLVAVLYLALAGSVVAFSAYVWLLRTEPPSRVATYAFVNPLVALALGSVFAGEALTPRVGLAALLIIGGVVLTLLPARRAAALPAAGALTR